MAEKAITRQMCYTARVVDRDRMMHLCFLVDAFRLDGLYLIEKFPSSA